MDEIRNYLYASLESGKKLSKTSIMAKSTLLSRDRTLGMS